MHIHSILLENFRDIRRAEILLGNTTVLIGENDCGRSKILEALSLALSDSAQGIEFETHHFCANARAKSQAGLTRLVLTFEQSFTEEWSTAVFKPVRELLSQLGEGPGRLRFEIEAASPSDVHWRLASAGKSIDGSSRPELLAWLRGLSPVIRLRSGLMIEEDKQAGAFEDPEIARYASKVETHLAALVGGKSANAGFDLQSGYDAAQKIISLSTRHLAPKQRGSAWLLEEFGAASRGEEDRNCTDKNQQSAAAYRLGLLLFVGKLLQARRQPLSEGAYPLIIFEDPECNLHPMTLASVWSLIERLKWQKLITTHSGELLSEAPLQTIRRLEYRDGLVHVFQIPGRELSKEDLRRLRYHVRARHDSAMFARCWLLVEGETEFWIVPQMARVLGHDLESLGVACVEFAQCGIVPLIKSAQQLGIEWHLLADGDQAGRAYSRTAEQFCSPGQRASRITRLQEPDIEHCFWNHGFSRVIEEVVRSSKKSKVTPTWIIRKAVEKTSKPFLALRLSEAAISRGPRSVPAVLRDAIERSIALTERDPLHRFHKPHRQVAMHA